MALVNHGHISFGVDAVDRAMAKDVALQKAREAGYNVRGWELHRTATAKPGRYSVTFRYQLLTEDPR